MASNDWDETAPLGTTAASEIDDIVRDLKADLRERMVGGGHVDLSPGSGISTLEDWKHIVDASYNFSVFSSTASGSTNEVYRVRSNLGTDAGAGTGLRIRRSVSMHVPGALVNATDYSPMWRISIPNASAVTLVAVHADVVTAPSGANLDCNIMRWTTNQDYSDTGVGFDILNADLEVTNGDNHGTESTFSGSFDEPADGDVYRIRVKTAANASSLTMSIVYDYYERGF